MPITLGIFWMSEKNCHTTGCGNRVFTTDKRKFFCEPCYEKRLNITQRQEQRAAALIRKADSLWRVNART